MRPSLATFALVAFTIPFATSCSFAFAKAPPGEPAVSRGCTQSYAAPVVDAVIGAGALAAAVYLSADDPNNDTTIPVGATLTLAWSAGDWFGAVRRCRRLTDGELLAWAAIRHDLQESKTNNP